MEKTKINLPKIEKRQTVEFGLVAILVVCAFALLLNTKILIFIALVICLITILVPLLLYPLAFVWFTLSAILNKISMVLLLGLVFYLIVTPMGLFRRVQGKDPLRLKQFKQNKHSVMANRDHIYTAADMTDTF